MITQQAISSTTAPIIKAPVLTASQLCKSFGEAESKINILQNVNLVVQQGESVAIIGSSGSGKSTLLGLLAGLDVPSSGYVDIERQSFSHLDEDARAAVRGQCMGFVFQSFQLLSNLTALENVMIPLQLSKQQGAKAIALAALEQVGLSKRMTHYPKQLSGGEQQRVAIARAFAVQPAILFADEPTGNLDRATGQQVVDLLFNLNKQSATTLILVTHDAQLAKLCDQTYELRQGVLRQNSIINALHVEAASK